MSIVKYSSKYFQLKEFRCPCCGQVKISVALVVSLETLRRTWGGPILVNSGFRCLKHNKEVGGAAGSRHLIGCAADIRPLDPALIGVFRNLCEAMFSNLEGWELKPYSTFVHVAVPREEEVRLWEERKIEILCR